MKTLSFELTMPGVNSWNGKWSGEKKRFIKIIRVGADCIAQPSNYGYNFGDGWYANVEVREIAGKEARKLRRISAGFCGYDWMINEIRFHGRILTLEERHKNKALVEAIPKILMP